MPTISSFYGILIQMFWRDHAPPHFHALYAEHEALIDIRTLEVIEGGLPKRALALVLEWASEHRSELSEDWHEHAVAEEDRSAGLTPPVQPAAPWRVARMSRALPGFRFHVRFSDRDGRERGAGFRPFGIRGVSRRCAMQPCSRKPDQMRRSHLAG
jgi:hypothetical protein